METLFVILLCLALFVFVVVVCVFALLYYFFKLVFFILTAILKMAPWLLLVYMCYFLYSSISLSEWFKAGVAIQCILLLILSLLPKEWGWQKRRGVRREREYLFWTFVALWFFSLLANFYWQAIIYIFAAMAVKYIPIPGVAVNPRKIRLAD